MTAEERAAYAEEQKRLARERGRWKAQLLQQQRSQANKLAPQSTSPQAPQANISKDALNGQVTKAATKPPLDAGVGSAAVHADQRPRLEPPIKDTDLLARKEAFGKAKKILEVRLNKETEEKQEKEAFDKDKKEAAEKEVEEGGRQEAIDKVRKEAEEKAKREVEERVKREAFERAKKEAEDRAKKEAGERERQEAAARAEREALDKVQRDAMELAAKEAQERAQAVAREESLQEADMLLGKAKAAVQAKAYNSARSLVAVADEAYARGGLSDDGREVKLMGVRQSIKFGEAAEAVRREEEDRVRRRAAEERIMLEEAAARARALHEAAKALDAAVAKILLYSSDGNRGGLQGLLDGIPELAERLEVTDSAGNTPFLLACREGHQEVAELLLDQGARLQATNKDGMSALHLAMAYRHQQLVLFLLSKGADPSARNLAGNDYLQHAEAVQGGKKGPEAVQVDEAGLLGLSPMEQIKKQLFEAAEQDRAHQVSGFFKGGMSADVRDKYGNTVLLVAAAMGHLSVAHAAVEAGCNLNSKLPQTGETALDVARRAHVQASLRGRASSHAAVVDYLERKGAVSSTAPEGNGGQGAPAGSFPPNPQPPVVPPNPQPPPVPPNPFLTTLNKPSHALHNATQAAAPPPNPFLATLTITPTSARLRPASAGVRPTTRAPLPAAATAPLPDAAPLPSAARSSQAAASSSLPASAPLPRPEVPRLSASPHAAPCTAGPGGPCLASG